MKHSITNERLHRLFAVVFWLLIWQAAAMLLGQRLLLVSPWETLCRLLELMQTKSFYASICFTLSRILIGFFAAVFASLIFGSLSARFSWIRILLAPLLSVMKSVPVASFVILALIWMPSRQLSILISFLIAFPILYAAVQNGMTQADPTLLEMAHVFRMPLPRRILYIYLPSILPSFRSAACVAIGLAWKSGVAAEVIGFPSGSIGEKLYKAKLYLATPDLFAWTLTIVIVSFLCEHLFLRCIDAWTRHIQGE